MRSRCVGYVCVGVWLWKCHAGALLAFLVCNSTNKWRPHVQVALELFARPTVGLREGVPGCGYWRWKHLTVGICKTEAHGRQGCQIGHVLAAAGSQQPAAMT